MPAAAIRQHASVGFALVGAGVIAAAPLAAPPPDIHLPSISTVAVDLAAAVNPLDAYGQLLSNTVNNLGTLANATFAHGVAPILQQIITNQLVNAQNLGAGLNEVLTDQLPMILQTALDQLGSGQFQAATETIASGVVSVALPLLPPLLAPLNNFVNVVNQLPTVALATGLALIEPPLALLQATGQAVQGITDALTAGDPVQVLGAVLSAPAVMVDGFINGYLPSQTGGLLTPLSGALSLLVTIRDTILTAITPPAAVAAARATDAIASTKTDAATTVTLDVTKKGAALKAVDSKAAATDTAATADQAASGESADGAATAGSTTDAASGEAEGATDPTAAKGDESTTTKDGESTSKGDTTTKDGESTSKGDTTTKDGESTSKGDTTSKGDDTSAKGDTTGRKGDTTTKGGDSAKGGDTTKPSTGHTGTGAKGGTGTKQGSGTHKDAGSGTGAAKTGADKK